MSDLMTLETVSERLGNIPLSTLKHRIAQLGIPAAARGARNKLLFDARAVALIEASDGLIKQGLGMHTVRRQLGLDAVEAPAELSEPAATRPAESPALEVLIPAAAIAGPSAPRPAIADASLAESLARLAEGFDRALGLIAEKDAQIERLQVDLRRAHEASATFQQKTFYLQSEMQRLQGELRDARAKEAKFWLRRLWMRFAPDGLREPNGF